MKNRLLLLASILAGIVAVGVLGFMRLEGLSPFEALYLTVITVTTVGYGDITPLTTGGRILAMLLVLVGFGTFTAFIVTSTQLVLQRAETRRRDYRTGIVIGLYFSELGRSLLRLLISHDAGLRGTCFFSPAGDSWQAADFDALVARLRQSEFRMDLTAEVLPELKRLLNSKYMIMVRLLESPNVLEHELFLNVLRSVFHLRDELLAEVMPNPAHLNDDASRAASLSAQLWIEYMTYLRASYPALFTSALAANPFTRNESSICET